MIPPKEIKAIRKKLKSGYPAGELENELFRKGYSEAEIEAILYNASIQTHTGIKKEETTTKVSMWNLAGVSLIILGISLYGVDTNFKKYSYFVLAVGILCCLRNLIIAARNSKEKE